MADPKGFLKHDRKVLEAKAKAEADGLDENEIANAMMEALHG